jgi:hypothetical protein
VAVLEPEAVVTQVLVIPEDLAVAQVAMVDQTQEEMELPAKETPEVV